MKGGEQGGVCEAVGLSLARAIVCAEDQPEMAAQLLLESGSQTYLIGGSIAQRELFGLLSDYSASRAGKDDLVGVWGG